jgi:hypothetical protein
MVKTPCLQAKRRLIAVPERDKDAIPREKSAGLAGKLLKKSLSFKLLLQRARSVDF